MGNHRARRLPSISEGLTLRTRERRDADVYYICGFDPSWNIHLRPCGIVLYNLQGEKVAATTENSDGWC